MKAIMAGRQHGKSIFGTKMNTGAKYEIEQID